MSASRKPSKKLTFVDAVQIWMDWLANHTFQNRIAAKYDVNPGRVNEVLKEKRHAGSRAIAMDLLGLA